MRIAFLGAQGTGKSSLVNEMLKMDEFKNHTQYVNTQRILNGYLGETFPHSSKTNDLSQISITSNLVVQLLNNENLICDRSLLDTFTYATLSQNVLNAESIENTFNKAVELYDVIFYTPHEFKIISDGFRETDEKYVELVDKTIKNYIEKYKDKVKIVTVSGSVNKRLDKIVETVKELKE